MFLGRSAAFDLRDFQPASDTVERLCNRLAAELLVPEQQFRRAWRTVREDGAGAFEILAREFKVSALVIARRAVELSLADRQTFLAFYRDYQAGAEHGKRTQTGGGDFHVNQNLRVGRPFATAVVRAVREGKILYSEAYRLTGLYGGAFEQRTPKVGVSKASTE